jgi:hypothetical protein
MPHDLGIFRSMLAAAPSAQSFDAIMDAIDFFDTDLDMLTLYLLGNLSRWPAHIPRCVPEVAMIASSPAHLSPLLVLCNTLHVDAVLHVLDDATFAALLHSPMLSSIHTLHTAHGLDEARCLALLGSAHLSSLHTLTSRHTEYGTSSMLEALGQAPAAFSLRTLDLRHAHLRSLESLTHTTCLTQLTHLHLQHNSLNDDAISQLVTLDLARLQHLDLRHNKIGMKSAQALATSSLPSLRWLDCDLHDIGIKGAQELATSTTLPPIVRRFWRAQCLA